MESYPWESSCGLCEAHIAAFSVAVGGDRCRTPPPWSRSPALGTARAQTALLPSCRSRSTPTAPACPLCSLTSRRRPFSCRTTRFSTAWTRSTRRGPAQVVSIASQFKFKWPLSAAGKRLTQTEGLRESFHETWTERRVGNPARPRRCLRKNGAVSQTYTTSRNS